jgi:hypothetical protein
MNQWIGWLLALGAPALGYVQYGWRGALLGLTLVVFWLVLQFNRAVRVMRLGDGRLVVNPGSVGLQAYDDEHPHPHVVENASPHARYALLTRSALGWQVDLRSVPYDHEAAALLADANRRPDWADALRTGFVGRREPAA